MAVTEVPHSADAQRPQPTADAGESWRPQGDERRVSGSRVVTLLFVVAAVVFFGMIAARYKVRGQYDAAQLVLNSVPQQHTGPELAHGEKQVSLLHAALADAAPSTNAPRTGVDVVAQAQQALASREVAKAIELGRRAVRETPQEPSAWLVLSEAHQLQGDATAARLALESCVQIARDAAGQTCRDRLSALAVD